MNSVAILALTSAILYSITMLAHESLMDHPDSQMTFIIALALLSAGAFEIAALRQERLGLIYVAILGAEVVIIGLASILHFAESYSVREVAGVSLVVVGAFLLWS